MQNQNSEDRRNPLALEIWESFLLIMPFLTLVSFGFFRSGHGISNLQQSLRLLSRGE